MSTEHEKLTSSFAEVVRLIQESRHKAFRAVNVELIDLYWMLGEYISQKVESMEWGSGVVDQLAIHISRQLPEARGFTRRNLFRMKQLYETYHHNEKVSPLVRQLPWTHNLIILGKSKSEEEREFYLRLSIREQWTKRELENRVDSALFERTLLSPIVSPAVTLLYPKADEIFRDTYLFDFLNLPDSHSEHDLQKALIANLKKFILELGRDFSFLGEEFRLQVGKNDFSIDLLFFQRELQCLVAFDLKIDDFKPEYLGKLSFYLEALDRDYKKPHEKPSVGVLLCKSRNAEVVEYALSRTLSPALVTEYQLRLPDKALLEQKLHEFYELQSRRETQAP